MGKNNDDRDPLVVSNAYRAYEPLVPPFIGSEARATKPQLQRLIRRWGDYTGRRIADPDRFEALTKKALLERYVIPRGGGLDVDRLVADTVPMTEDEMDETSFVASEERWYIQNARELYLTRHGFPSDCALAFVMARPDETIHKTRKGLLIATSTGQTRVPTSRLTTFESDALETIW